MRITSFRSVSTILLTTCLGITLTSTAHAWIPGQRLMQRWHKPSSNQENTKNVATEDFQGRPMLVFTPTHLPPEGSRALVIVLHGGLGSAEHVVNAQAEKGLNMNGEAEKYGFIVAYLNGTKATRFFGADKLAWNAGGDCCGQPAVNHIDDVSYITHAADYLVTKYGIDRNRIYGIGHSNGAMMTQRILCEKGLYAAAIPISGPLNLNVDNCPGAHGKHILAIHGANDQNVPITGGQGTKGFSKATYNSQAYSQQTFTRSGATYTLQVAQGADHKLDHIEESIEHTEGLSIAQKATRFFGLNR